MLECVNQLTAEDKRYVQRYVVQIHRRPIEIEHLQSWVLLLVFRRSFTGLWFSQVLSTAGISDRCAEENGKVNFTFNHHRYQMDKTNNCILAEVIFFIS